MNKFNNLPELFYFQADKNENNQHLLKLDSNNQVISMSWLETKNLTTKIVTYVLVGRTQGGVLLLLHT